ncbi:MAG: GH25 family lysozyme [Ferruginibacter sp.]
MLKGIDTSHFSNFNLQQLKDIVHANKLYFNFIKASEGATIQDAKFIDIWQMSRSAGLICGAYHFFRPLADAGLQAGNFIHQYKKVSRAGVLPPVVDIEWATVKVSGNSVEQWKQLLPVQRIPKIKIFLSALEEEFKIKPIIYTAPAFWKEFINDQASSADNTFFAEFPLWVVDLKRTGKVPMPWAERTVPFIQTHFGEHATTPDLFDKLDQNEFNGDTKTILNSTVPGFTIMKGFPFSNIVKDLQTKLIELGHLAGSADGQFGTNTETAVKAFQKAIGLFENGIVDAQTWNKLL